MIGLHRGGASRNLFGAHAVGLAAVTYEEIPTIEDNQPSITSSSKPLQLFL